MKDIIDMEKELVDGEEVYVSKEKDLCYDGDIIGKPSLKDRMKMEQEKMFTSIKKEKLRKAKKGKYDVPDKTYQVHCYGMVFTVKNPVEFTDWLLKDMSRIFPDRVYRLEDE
jgi:hypothetical protein